MKKLCLLLLLLTTLSSSEMIHFTQSPANEATVKIDKHGPLSATLELTIPAIGKFPKRTTRGVYDYIRVKNLPGIQDIGKPSLPVYNCTFAVGKGARFSYTVLDTECTIIENVNVHPALRPHEDSRFSEYETFVATRKYDKEPEFEMETRIYNTNAFFPGALAEVYDVSVYRNTSLAGVRLCPVQYNPVTKQLKVYTRLKVRVSFSGGRYVPGLKNQSEKIVQRIAVNGKDYTRLLQKRMDDEKDDIIVITTPTFIKPVEALVRWQRQKGYDVKIDSRSSWDTSSVRKAVKDFWDANEEPEYMLIVGDFEDVPPDSFDYRTWTDLPYVMFDGPDDKFAEMASGRIAVSNEKEAWTVVNKILQYECNPVTDDEYYKNFLVCSQFEDLNKNDTADKRFTHTAYEMKLYMEKHNYTVTHLTDVYDDEENPMYWNADTYSFGGLIPEYLRRPDCAWNHNEDDISAEINKGKFLILHRDHGMENGWAWPRFRSEHVRQLENGDKRPIVFSLNCLTGRFKSDTCFAEVFLREKNGAVGIIAACRESYSGCNDAYCHGLFDAIWPGTAMNSPHNENPDTIDHDPIVTMGDVTTYGYFHMRDNWAIFTDAARLFHWFGDPTTSIRTEKPKTLTAKCPNLIQPTATDFSVSSLNITDGYATLYSKGSDKIVGKVKVDNTNITIPVTSTLTLHDTLILTVTSHNYLPLIKDIPVSKDQTMTDGSVNPVKAVINLWCNGHRFVLNGNRDVSVTLFAVNGQKVFSRHWAEVNKDIKLSTFNLSSGRYLIRVKLGNWEMAAHTLIMK